MAARARALLLLACSLLPLRAFAEDRNTKVTAGVYFVPSEAEYDLNLRHKFGSFVAWLGNFYQPATNGTKPRLYSGPVRRRIADGVPGTERTDIGRVGAEYDFQITDSVLLVPTVNLATNRLVAGQVYSELGTRAYLIAGYSQTNLKSFYNLSWDPNESVQAGAGIKVGDRDKVSSFIIYDVRLHTGQQDTHLLWRHKLDGHNEIRFDGLFKSGHTDEKQYVRGFGASLYFDRPSWFVKTAYDPYVNFSGRAAMWRIGAGSTF